MTEIKMIASDLDSTFLNDKKHYHKPHFTAILNRLLAQNGHFVVASGRDVASVDPMFKSFAGQYDLVADNGAVVRTAKGEIIQMVGLHVKDVAVIMEVVNTLPFQPIHGAIFTGITQPYMLKSQARINLTHKAKMAKLYPNLKFIDSVDQINEPILKVTITYEENKMQAFIDAARLTLDDRGHVTTSGYGSVDIVAPKINKANGLQVLASHYGFKLNENLAAFGDGLNDAEMLAAAARPFAMINGDETLKDLYPLAVDDNNHDGVLKTIDTLI
ncbi:Cof-type HAD-IIB family hydrolase [Weissella hellenica]|uniref:Cof-type HAD-IIB family hydrolase n=1 Tax=Weissella hellenica TaxID=46256 RepID=A0A4Y4G7W3_WEIHE|nr:Cof-type HAD-IIB family hydrolase [Weissella hellenica]NKY66461.1 Cof-type HAD-IIB family hydrolase [Weissella hellenica]GED35408.1 sugar phosphatase SupH [Weissella hellenica]SCB73988.1 hypothetical protein GA0061075_101143 [Weissella hellenica]